jgi:hypothetical protein
MPQSKKLCFIITRRVLVELPRPSAFRKRLMHFPFEIINLGYQGILQCSSIRYYPFDIGMLHICINKLKAFLLTNGSEEICGAAVLASNQGLHVSWEEFIFQCMCKLVISNIFFSSGDPLEIEMEIVIASFDSISEVNMVSTRL